MPAFMVLERFARSSGKKARSLAAEYAPSKAKSLTRPYPHSPDKGYPQNLWVTVWMTCRREYGKSYNAVTLSNWLIFRQGISILSIK